MCKQIYRLYLCDGNTAEIIEPMGIPVHRTFASRYEKASENSVLQATELGGSVLLVPKMNILYLRTITEMTSQRRI